MKIAIGMSGGVDSSVAAKMLVDQGHEVIGLFLKLWSDPECKIERQNRCCDYEALEDARQVANQLNIPFYVINARDEFKNKVVDDFIHQYSKLKTPNPCIVCNDKIKFNLLLTKALSLDCEKLATGHYARIIEDNSGNSNIKHPTSNYHLLTGVDKEKDQSYMLYRLNQYQLSHVLFPLGEMTKKEVRQKAVEWDLPVKEKAESQEICFVGEKDYRVFLHRYLSEEFFKPGEIVDAEGLVVGQHDGLINYTIGQRKGIEQVQNEILNIKYKKFPFLSSSGRQSHPSTMSSASNGGPGIQVDRKPLYVVGFNVKLNQLIVGEDKETYSKEMTIGNLHWINPHTATYEVASLVGMKVKIRYRHPTVKGNLKYKKENIKNIEVLFEEPQRAVTPGQSAVFYKGEEVIGGGVIVK